ncbi:Hypothetical protein PAU_03617 [Photorhabdus asymbiotica]|uniref:Uncharacterized protein n=1 Tax=Photorhabdus asymbiotica subsp. asymbiotica (strain ATCC 43949 / 3105-77) TaxID=553480 RepID=C7BL30_PHOAA|nr:Hypothetical protein PAU_03617 [Photorhabdus asymbiotica]
MPILALREKQQIEMIEKIFRKFQFWIKIGARKKPNALILNKKIIFYVKNKIKKESRALS